MGIKIWQWTCILLLIVFSFLVYYVIKFLVIKLFKLIIYTKIYPEVAAELSYKNSVRIFSIILTVYLIIFLLPSVQLPAKLNFIVIRGLNILLIFLSIFLLLRITDVLFSQVLKLAEKTETKMDNQLTPIMKKMTHFLIWVVGIIFVLTSLNINVMALLAGLSIGGLALALAAQDTIKNFLGSITIFLDKPFQIGDYIKVNDVEGIAEEVGIRSTRIRTFENSLVYIPNAVISDETIDNYGLRKFRRYKTEIGITYDTPPKNIEIFVEGIRKILLMHPDIYKENVQVHLNNFGQSSLNILIYCFFNSAEWETELKGKHKIMSAIIKLANDLGIRFAFPTQTLHIEEFPEKKLGTPPSKNIEQANQTLNISLNEIKSYFNENVSE